MSRRRDPKGEDPKREIVWIGTAQSYEELDALMERYRVSRCVIDALPEVHATRTFAGRFSGRVWLCYFNDNQKGSYRWDQEQRIVRVNRTEALDAAKRGIRDGAVVLPRRIPLMETFTAHLASDAKRLIEDEETGAKSYRYVRTGTNHYSLAFTYDWIASERERRGSSRWRPEGGLGTDDLHVGSDSGDATRGSGVAAETAERVLRGWSVGGMSGMISPVTVAFLQGSMTGVG